VRASRIDLAALDVAAEDFLAAVLDTVAQPIWVVDPGDLIRFANPAAVLHGRLVVEDRADSGTLVAAEIPLADALPAAGRP
jgi:PAS domain-containing protein